MCTDTLVGNLSLWSIAPNVSSIFLGITKADAMNEEWNVKVNFLKKDYSFL